MERALMLGNLNKNTKRKEVKKMKMKGLKIGIISLLTLGLLGFYLLSPALADTDPSRGSTTQIIDIYFGYDQSGHLTSQSGSQTINGVDLQGNSFTTTIELNYDVINGKAVLLSSTSTTTASNPDGSSRTSSTTTNYHYNENGILMSADGSGSAHGWEKDQLDWVDEDGDGIQDTDDDGNLLYYDADGNHTADPEQARMKRGAYYESSTTMTYAIVNGQAILTGTSTTTTRWGATPAIVDVNGDGEINADDMVQLIDAEGNPMEDADGEPVMGYVYYQDADQDGEIDTDPDTGEQLTTTIKALAQVTDYGTKLSVSTTTTSFQYQLINGAMRKISETTHTETTDFTQTYTDEDADPADDVDPGKDGTQLYCWSVTDITVTYDYSDTGSLISASGSGSSYGIAGNPSTGVAECFISTITQSYTVIQNVAFLSHYHEEKEFTPIGSGSANYDPTINGTVVGMYSVGINQHWQTPGGGGEFDMEGTAYFVVIRGEDGQTYLIKLNVDMNDLAFNSTATDARAAFNGDQANAAAMYNALGIGDTVTFTGDLKEEGGNVLYNVTLDFVNGQGWGG